jgi:hypothetical protein
MTQKTNANQRLGVVLMDDDGVTYDLSTLIALIGSADDEAGANTVIGQLKQIATNTTPT